MAGPLDIAIGVVWHQGRVLVGVRGPGQSLPGYHEFPGGKVEPNETPADAAARECREETGLHVRVLGLRRVVDHAYPRGPLRLHCFDCLADPAEADAVHTPFLWETVERALTLVFPEANRPLLDDLRRHPAPLAAEAEAIG